jgi:hypothetical protein
LAAQLKIISALPGRWRKLAAFFYKNRLEAYSRKNLNRPDNTRLKSLSLRAYFVLAGRVRPLRTFVFPSASRVPVSYFAPGAAGSLRIVCGK